MAPSSTVPSSLWLAADGSARFFRIPDDTQLPAGDFGIRAGDGRTVAVDPVALDIYELDPAEARAALGERLGSAWATTRKVLEGISQAAADRRAGIAPDGPRLSDDPRATMAEGLGLDRDTLTEDPAAFVEALQKLARDVGAAAAELKEDEPTARARFQAMAEALREEGDEDAAAAMEAVPERLRSTLASDEARARIEQATDGLRAMAAGLRARTAAARAAREADRGTPAQETGEGKGEGEGEGEGQGEA